MDNEYEDKRLVVGHAIENQHRLDGEMPRTGTIRRGHDDGEVSHHKGYQRTAQSQLRRKVEAEEGEVVMQEVHHPDADGEEQV